VGADGAPVWPLNRYLDEGPRRAPWLGSEVTKQHRGVAGHVMAVLGAGLVLRRLEEWGPSAAQIAAHPDWARERERPPFLLWAADRV
jgi:hypothetical protein